MPGICGIVDTDRRADACRVLSSMLERMRHEPGYVVQRYADPTSNVGLGRVSLGFVNASPQPVRTGGGGVVTVMDGELYDREAVCSALASRGVEVAPEAQAELLAAGLATLGPEFLRGINGSFVAASWDAERRVLTLVNDRFAMRPVYYSVIGGCLLFSSGLAALLADAAVPATASKVGLSQFLTYGQYLGEETSVESIKVLPASCIARFEADTGALSLERYWTFDDYARLEPRSEREWLERIDQCFYEAVQRQVRAGGELGLALSGGLDARTILAVVDQAETPVTSICYGMHGSLDHHCSRRMTDLVGGRYFHYELGPEFLREFRTHLERMVQLTDGQYLSQCIVLPTLPVYRQQGIEVLLRGHAGELMHMRKAYAYSLDQEGLAAPDDAAIEGWLMRHLQSYMLDTVDGPLLTPEYQAALEAAPAESLRACLAACGETEIPAQKVWRMFIDQRLRRETALSMTKFGSTVDVRLPYLDNALVEVLLAAPPALKMTDTIQGHILAHRRPELLRVVNANTGAQIGAPRILERIATFKLKALGRLGVPGYQPYERLGLWLRRELAWLVREILLSEQCLGRGIFHPDGVRQVVENHLRGERNSTFLLMALMILELQQRLLHGEPAR